MLAIRTLTASRKHPPPLWFVTNGDHTVGPVRTDLLLRGVAFGRIPDDCLVRELRWKSWRRLEQIREVRALWKEQLDGNDQAVAAARRTEVDAGAWLAPAGDASEVLLFTLHAAATLTGAAAGVCHRARGGGRAVASYAHGAAGHALLGKRLSDRDPSIALAHAGHGTIGEPDAGPVELAIFDRLGAGALSGVAMFPVRFGSELLAVVELGRSDHPFRERDAAVLEELSRAATARLIELA